MSDIRQQLLAAFDVEHQEHLAAIRQVLAQGGDLGDAFRRAHSLKGAARAVDLPAVEELAHRLESILLKLLDEGGRPDRQTLDALNFGLDAIEGHAAALHLGRPPPDSAQAVAALDARLNGAPPVSAPAPSTPPASAVDASRAQTTDQIERPPPGEAVEYIRVEAGQVDRVAEAMQGLTAQMQGQQALEQALRQLQADALGLARLWDGARRTGGAAKAAQIDQAVRGLCADLGALTRRQAQAAWAMGQQVRRTRDQIERIALTPAEEVFGGFARMTRDLGRETGLEVDFQTQGLSAQADRKVLQALKDPVMHLVRNAVSHGGGRSGKPLRVVLKAAIEGDRLMVSVTDDGAGPDLSAIERRGVEAGLLPARPAEAPAPSADQLLALVFEPGFSTARTIDRLSGRGVGLSVVAEAARALKGVARLEPVSPHGARAVIAVPLSAARQTIMLAEAGGQTYALPVAGVERVLRLAHAALESVEGRPTARIAIDGDDVVVPVVPIATLIDLTAVSTPLAADQVKALLVNRGGRRLALAVDAVHDVREAVVGEAAAPGLDADLFTGVVLLDNDAPALALNPDALVRRWMSHESRLAAAGLGWRDEAAAARPARTILVVDDSFTTRTLEKSILEAQGYRVLLSIDGLEALETLRAGQAVIDLVVADVEMPRMDGFSLLQAIKADAALAALPVILMTSRESPEDVQRGLSLGADAYLTKQKFDQRELLATIGQML